MTHATLTIVMADTQTSPLADGGIVIPIPDDDADCPWSQRESELLAVTLDLLQEHGYDRLTMDAVANTAHASKATLYRRWPTKAELVLAAFVEGTRQASVEPDTGTLRGDLLQLGEAICAHAAEHAGTIRAVLVEVSRNADLAAILQLTFLDEKKAAMERLLTRAADRGEITAGAATEDLWDVLSGYLIFRSILTNRTPSLNTVEDLVDHVLLPGLTRHNA